MPESFDCPRCGAPLQYNAEQDGNKETITCPYCGESVIVPESLRQHNQEAIALGEVFKPETIELDDKARPTVIRLDTEAPARSAQAAKKGVGICLVIALLVVGFLGVVGIFTYSTIKNSVMQAVNPVKTNPAFAISTEVTTMLARVTEIVAELTDTPEIVPSVAVDTPTPRINTTATARAEATLAAQGVLAETQRNWPVVLQEKFTNDSLNWNVGTDNNQYAIEDVTIAANKYTWKFTTKKSMGSFSFPDMAPQTDMFVSVDLQMTSTSPYNDDQAGIIFRSSTKDQSFYFFGINPKGSYELSMYDGSGWNDMIPFSSSDLIKDNQVNHLAVSIQGSQILLMINNSVVNSFEDSQLSTGGAGLGLEVTSAGVDATVIFSNFFVRAPKP